MVGPARKEAVRLTAARIADAHRLLAGRYGIGGHCAHEGLPDPISNLVLTILSQNTTDANRDRAYASLMARFKTLAAIETGDESDVEASIRVGGLPKAKARSIQGALRRLREERGKLSLDHVAKMKLDEARAYLTSFPGIGVKTANIILLFSFGFPAFPVDTHILRVTKRLGWVPESADLAKAAHAIEPLVPVGAHVPFHMNLIALGKELCKPSKPRCDECPLLALCPEGGRNTKTMKGSSR